MNTVFSIRPSYRKCISMIQNILKPPINKAFKDRAIATLLLNNQDKEEEKSKTLK